MTKLLLLLSIAGFSISVNAADIKNGDKLHAGNCTRCHDTSVYTRENRRVSSLPKLGSQVRMCKNNLEITWFDDEVEDVTTYLNKSYYHF